MCTVCACCNSRAPCGCRAAEGLTLAAGSLLWQVSDVVADSATLNAVVNALTTGGRRIVSLDECLFGGKRPTFSSHTSERLCFSYSCISFHKLHKKSAWGLLGHCTPPLFAYTKVYTKVSWDLLSVLEWCRSPCNAPRVPALAYPCVAATYTSHPSYVRARASCTEPPVPSSLSATCALSEWGAWCVVACTHAALIAEFCRE